MAADAPIRYRPARAEDAEATFEVVKAAANDLLERSGRPPSAGSGLPPERVLRFRRSQVVHDPAGFWVAEAGATLVGAAIAVRRELTCYLAALHVLPGWQGRGIGGELMRRAMDDLVPDTTRTVLTDALNPDSNGLYLRAGMLPLDSTLTFDGPPAADLPEVRTVLASRPIDPIGDRAALDGLDRATVGFARPLDHAFWAAVPGLAGRLLSAGDRRVGYAYVSAGGAIGPVAVTDADHLSDALDACAALAVTSGAAALHLRAFGRSHAAIDWAAARGLRLTGIGLFLGSAPLGTFEGYVTSGADALY